MQDKQAILLSFLRKFFFILKAASEGWIVRYIGGDKFQFKHAHTLINKFKTEHLLQTTEQFLKNYIDIKLL